MTGVTGRRATRPVVTECVLGHVTKSRHRTEATTVTETPYRLKSAPTILASVSHQHLPTYILHTSTYLHGSQKYPRGVQSIQMILSVCLSAGIYLRNHTAELHQIFVAVVRFSSGSFVM